MCLFNRTRISKAQAAILEAGLLKTFVSAKLHNSVRGWRS